MRLNDDGHDFDWKWRCQTIFIAFGDGLEQHEIVRNEKNEQQESRQIKKKNKTREEKIVRNKLKLTKIVRRVHTQP